jgi:hypothetical protein
VTFINLLLAFMTIVFAGTIIVWAYDLLERHCTKED